MKEITYLTWIDVEDACNFLSNQLLQTIYKFDVLVSIQRGGCIPGVILSHLLRIPEYYSIGIRTTCSEEIKAIRLDIPIISNIDVLKGIQGKNVLIIDDVTNTGNTLRIAKDEVLKFEPLTCKTAVLIWDGDFDGDDRSLCKADYFSRYTPGWVVFPWEIIE
jgi:hypoxanthine phosphoribosyltransferase